MRRRPLHASSSLTITRRRPSRAAPSRQGVGAIGRAARVEEVWAAEAGRARGGGDAPTGGRGRTRGSQWPPRLLRWRWRQDPPVRKLPPPALSSPVRDPGPLRRRRQTAAAPPVDRARHSGAEAPEARPAAAPPVDRARHSGAEAPEARPVRSDHPPPPPSYPPPPPRRLLYLSTEPRRVAAGSSLAKGASRRQALRPAPSPKSDTRRRLQNEPRGPARRLRLRQCQPVRLSACKRALRRRPGASRAAARGSPAGWSRQRMPAGDWPWR